jgi:hypothetical protein
MNEKYISVYSAHGPIEAESIRSFLESFGLDAVLSRDAGMTFSFAIGALDVTDILVPDIQAEQAKSALEGMQSGAYQNGEPHSSLE